MQTINAQTIINELAALALAAPEEVQAAYNAPGYWVTVKTSERGTARLVNQKSNIEIYAAKVRKNATAFGGGLIKTPRPAPLSPGQLAPLSWWPRCWKMASKAKPPPWRSVNAVHCFSWRAQPRLWRGHPRQWKA